MSFFVVTLQVHLQVYKQTVIFRNRWCTKLMINIWSVSILQTVPPPIFDIQLLQKLSKLSRLGIQKCMSLY